MFKEFILIANIKLFDDKKNKFKFLVFMCFFFSVFFLSILKNKSHHNYFHHRPTDNQGLHHRSVLDIRLQRNWHKPQGCCILAQLDLEADQLDLIVLAGLFCFLGLVFLGLSCFLSHLFSHRYLVTSRSDTFVLVLLSNKIITKHKQIKNEKW